VRHDRDSFGELELPLVAVVSFGSAPVLTLVRQSGGGTSFGEVNRDGDSPVSITRKRHEFGAIPQSAPR
jgi:hypothetical protein